MLSPIGTRHRDVYLVLSPLSSHYIALALLFLLLETSMMDRWTVLLIGDADVGKTAFRERVRWNTLAAP
jgi:GTPase SAR1 family protein